MRILAVGGGSGGHVTPIAAVLASLRKREASAEFKVWCDYKFYHQATQTIHHFDQNVEVERILSGKLRRYHTLPLWKQFLRLRTIVFPNIRDGFLIAGGTIQSFYKLVRWRPDIIFCKGGFVCLPVGIAAHLLRIPIVLHDSDAHPGLTNRVLSRWAAAIGTGAPLKHYSYPVSKATYVGIPIDARFRRHSKSEQDRFKQEIGFSTDRPLVVVTGGGLGAKTMNDAVVSILDELLMSCNVLLISGAHHATGIRNKTSHFKKTHFQLHAFISKTILETLAAADLVVARAGATTLLELAALAKPTIIIPNPYLTGGHQLKNAAVYEEKNAAVILDEMLMIHQPHALLDTITSVVLNPAELRRMSEAIHTFAKPDAAETMAEIILGEV